MSEDPISSARSRENPEPQEKNLPIPRVLLIAICAAVAWGIGYIALNQRNDAPELGDQRTLQTLQSMPTDRKAAVDGAQVFQANCAPCHQATGAGLPGVFPPLAGAQWVLGNDKLPVAIVLHGITGKLTVNDVVYNGQMPAFKDKLDDAQIAAVLSYARSNFGNSAGKIDAGLVKSEREASKDRKDPWKGDEDLGALKQP